MLAPCLPLGPIASGVGYGLAVWAGSYLGFLPALGLHPPATRESPGRNVMNIGAHLVWGATLGAVTDYLIGNGKSANGMEGRMDVPDVAAQL